MGVFAKCSKFSFRSLQWRDNLIDLVKREDVIREEERVRKDNVNNDLRVFDLSKVYTSLFRSP